MVLKEIELRKRKLCLHIVNYGVEEVREVGCNKRSLLKLPVITGETIAEISSRLQPAFFRPIDTIELDGIGKLIITHEIVNGEHLTNGPYFLMDG